MNLKMLYNVLLSMFFLVVLRANATDLTVKLAQGELTGVHNPHASVDKWLGIRYAQAPLGHLRWKAPVSLKASDDKSVTNKFGNLCSQNSKRGVIGSEDCLFLNVYRPSNNEKLPVMVYFHGGNNQTGSGAELNPEKFANELNAVVVTVNYRLGPLGFNPLQALKTDDLNQASGNFTLLDQAKSLDWIKENIEQFDGDPNAVTVSGFSAGGRDVMAMLISPIFKGKFQNAIVFSGGMTTSDNTESQRIFANKLAPLVVNAGIKSNVHEASVWLNQSNDDVAQFLYSLSDRALVESFPKAGIRMANFPHLYRDGYVLPVNGFKTTSYNSVPLMMFTGHDEFSFFAMFDPYFSKKDILGDTESNLEYRFAFKYGGLLYKRFNVERSAEVMSVSYHAPIYASEFNFGSDPKVVDEKLNKFGSFHGVYLPMLDPKEFNGLFSFAYQTKGAKSLSNVLKRQLKSFIHMGKPNSNLSPIWKKWDKTSVQSGQSIYVMDANKKSAVTYLSSTDYSDRDIFDMMSKDVTLSKAKKKFLINNILNGRWFSTQIDKWSSSIE